MINLNKSEDDYIHCKGFKNITPSKQAIIYYFAKAVILKDTIRWGVAWKDFDGWKSKIMQSNSQTFKFNILTFCNFYYESTDEEKILDACQFLVGCLFCWYNICDTYRKSAQPLDEYKHIDDDICTICDMLTEVSKVIDLLRDKGEE